MKLFKVGRRPARHTLRTARSMRVLFQHLAALGPPPTSSDDYLTPLKAALSTLPATNVNASLFTSAAPLGMYLNDQLGDCVCADTAHQVLVRTACAAESALVIPSTGEVLALYEAVGGYNPNAAPVNGQNPTDQGCDETSMEEFLQSTGFCGQKSAGSGMIDPAQLDHVRWGIQIFGGVRLGIVVDEQMEEQFSDGEPWDTAADPNDPNAGGHDVFAVGYDTSGFTVITWGGTALVTPELMANPAFLEETHPSVWPDFITATGSAPNGLNLQQLLADLPAVEAA